MMPGSSIFPTTPVLAQQAGVIPQGRTPQAMPPQAMPPQAMPPQGGMQARTPQTGMPQSALLPATALGGDTRGGDIRPKVRLQAADEAPPVPAQAARLSLPPPEALGIGVAPIAAPVVAPPPQTSPPTDWNATKQRLERIGAVSFRSDRLPQGGFRFTVLVPAEQGARHIEAEAASVGAMESKPERDCASGRCVRGDHVDPTPSPAER